MLKFLWRSTPAPVQRDDTDPLRIRNLLDDPQLRAVMGSSLDGESTGRRPSLPAPDLATFRPTFALEGAA